MVDQIGRSRSRSSPRAAPLAPALNPWVVMSYTGLCRCNSFEHYWLTWSTPLISVARSRPAPVEYAPHHEKYVSLVPEDDILAAMAADLERSLASLRAIPEEVSLIRHEPYTWSIREVVGHIVDCERIFVHRALRFARRDPAELPGFEENDYARHARSDDFPLAEHIEEYELTRRSGIAFFRHLHPDDWDQSGIANGHRITVRALAYLVVGHEHHHMNIVRKRLIG